MNTRFWLDRIGLLALLALLLASCASNSGPAVGSPETVAVTESAAEPAGSSTADSTEDQLLEQQRAAEVAEAAERAREAADLERQRQAEVARQRAEAERQAEEERQQLAEQQRLEDERLAALAAEREAKSARINELETLIAELQAQFASGDAVNETMREAVLVSEQLLALLTEEQAKFGEDNLDEAGNLIVPPATDAIADLEARRDDLFQQIDGC